MKVASRLIGQSRAWRRSTRHRFVACDQVQPSIIQRGQAAAGFTVIEVMIVLVVTGGLFLAAAILISGRQNQTAFDQAVRQVQADIQQAINDVAVGYFPDTTFNCTAGASGPVLSNAPSSGQGSNSGCIFLGKAIQFQLHGTNPEQFAVYSLAGLQQAGGHETTSLTEAKPKTVAPSTSQPGTPDITEIKKLQGGLKTVRMSFNDGPGNIPIGAVAFVSTLASYDTSGGIKPGAQQVVVHPVAGSALDATSPQGAEVINTSTLWDDPSQSPPDPVNGVHICFASTTTDQSALIGIGGAKRTLSVTLKIYKGLTCS
ncbi:MAG TPA: type II secretion system protein [Candidatus Saccharimonadales bacterium]|nr:type II secretion system protein [Candidatus Saccharimonadales bacterium]